MANNLSFGVAVNLLTENFKRGQAQIQNGFREIKATALEMAGVLGAGLGFTHLIEKMIDVAKESAAVNKALKVASGGWAEYGENQKYIIELSDKYGLSINEMTGAFAKFTASAKTSNIPLKDQQSLFTGLNAALLATGASGDKKAEAFDAMSKMMQKGTIQLKPLIAGLGTALPESLSIMAKSMGASVEKLRDMAKHGQLLANDVFPKFGAELQKAFGNVDTDTIGGATNRIGNSFEELTAKLNVGNIYKNILNGASEAFKWVIENFKALGDAVVNIVTTVIIAKAFTAIKNGYATVSTAATESYIKQAVEAEKSAVMQELAGSTLSKKSQKRYLDESIAAAKSYAEQEAAVNKFGLTSSFAFKNVGLSIKSAFMSFLPMILISGAIAIYQHFSNLAEKAKELKAIWTDYTSGLKNAGESNGQLNDLKNSKKIIEDTTISLKERQTALNTINSILGTNYKYDKDGLKIAGDINKKISERLDLLDKQSKYQYLLSKQNPNDDKIAENQSKIDVIDNQLRSDINGGKNVNKGLVSDRQNLFNERDQLYKIRDNIAREKNKLKSELGNNTGETTSLNVDSNINKKEKKGKEDPIQKEEDDIAKKLTEYKNQLANKVITTSKYNELYDKLNKDSVTKLGGLLTPEQAKKDVVYQDALKGVANPLTSVDDKIDTAKDDYLKKLAEQDSYLKNGIITQDEYTNAMSGVVDEALRTVSAIKGVNFGTNDFIKTVKDKQKELQKKDYSFQLPVKPEIDHTFDYNKNDNEKLEDKSQQNDDYIKAIEKAFTEAGVKDIKKSMADANGDLTKLKAQFNGQADSLIDELNTALKKAPSLAEALKIAKVKEDVKDLQHQLNTGVYGSVKEIAGSAKNLYNSFKAVNDTFSNVKSTGWDKILAVWDAITNSIDNITTAIKTMQTLIALTDKLTKAKAAENKIEEKANKPELLKNTLKGFDTKKASVDISDLSKLAGSKTDSSTEDTNKKTDEDKTKVAANTAVAVSGAISSAADLPFPLNLVEMAGAAASVYSLIGNLPKFANGGIVQGSSFTGDKVIAGLNSGEMILNGGQQSTLFGLLNGQGGINGQNTGNGGTVEFVIEGKHLKGVLNNYDKIKSKV